MLEAPTGPPFKLLQSASLRELSLKAVTALLAFVKRVGDLQALSIDNLCIEFGPGDCRITLKPRKGYVLKVLSTPLKEQIIARSAFPRNRPGQDSLIHLCCALYARYMLYRAL